LDDLDAECELDLDREWDLDLDLDRDLLLEDDHDLALRLCLEDLKNTTLFQDTPYEEYYFHLAQ